MSPTEQITFAPEISERDLDREVGQIDDQLASVGEDVPVSFDQEELDSLSPPGGGAAAGGGGVGGAGAGAGAAAGLAGKIPKPVAGVTAAAAVPIALAGGVGLGLLSAMQSASARLQTDTKLLGIAVDNFFREPGNILSENVTRPIVSEFLSFSVDFDEALRSDQFIKAGGMLVDAALDISQMVNPTLWPSLVIDRAREVLLDTFADIDFRGVITDLWPGWPSVHGDWPGWPSINARWPGWPSIQADWPGWPEIQPVNLASRVTGVDLGSFVSPVDLSSFVDPLGGGGGGGETSGGAGGGGFFEGPIGGGFGRGPILPSGQAGGRVASGGLAEIHQGEFIGDRERLVSELADAIGAANGGGGGGGGGSVTVDTSALENEVQGLRRDVGRLASAMQDMELRTDSETIGRVASDGKRQRVADTDPTV
jgi:hypothetical protein